MRENILGAWRRAGASVEVALDEDAALSVARRLGAGRLLLGGVSGTPARFVLSASLLGVPGGRVEAQASVEGPVDSLMPLVDRLTAQLLIREAGLSEQRLATLTSTSLPALRAYLAGRAAYRRGAYEEGFRQYSTALDLDSTFALAGLGLVQTTAFYTSPQRDVVQRAFAIALAYSDRLSRIDRAFLSQYCQTVLCISGSADLAQKERALEIAPDLPELWYDTGDHLFHAGAHLGPVDSMRERAVTYLLRAYELDPNFAAPLLHLVELSALLGDTSAVRRFGAAYLAVDSVEEAADYIRWRVAQALHDSAGMRELRSRFDEMEDVSLLAIVTMGQVGGVGLGDVDLAATVLQSRSPDHRGLDILAGNRGRPAKALRLTEGWTGVRPASLERVRILDALYGDGDSTDAASAARRLGEYTNESADGSSGDSEDLVAYICVVEQWRLLHGDVTTIERSLAWLASMDGQVDSNSSMITTSTCTTLLEALHAHVGNQPNALDAVSALDSLFRTVPNDFRSYENLVVARLYEARGNHSAALRAVRRRGNNDVYLSSFLRTEAHLAELTGDREGAIRAYRHYLALRSDPEPSLQADVAAARAALARLLSERR